MTRRRERISGVDYFVGVILVILVLAAVIHKVLN